MAPPGELGGHMRLPGGSHCSPGSTIPLPHTGPGTVLVVVPGADVVVVTVGCVVVVTSGLVVVVVASPHTILPSLHAASTLDRHCPRWGVPGGPQVAWICGRH